MSSWTKADYETLMKFSSRGATLEETAVALGRTKGSVRVKKSAIKHSDSPWSTRMLGKVGREVVLRQTKVAGKENKVAGKPSQVPTTQLVGKLSKLTARFISDIQHVVAALTKNEVVQLRKENTSLGIKARDARKLNITQSEQIRELKKAKRATEGDLTKLQGSFNNLQLLRKALEDDPSDWTGFLERVTKDQNSAGGD